MHSLARRLMNDALSKIAFRGDVLDLGGSKKSDYMELVKKTATSIQVINLDTETAPDIFSDLEQPLPCKDHAFDTVIVLNVLEHIYNYRQLLQEAYRVLRPQGEIIIFVPFLLQVHPSPNDFFRYTRETLERLLVEQGFQAIAIQEAGSGVWSVQCQLMHNFLPAFFMAPLQYLAPKLDALFSFVTRALKKSYQPKHYPLGYLARAYKRSSSV